MFPLKEARSIAPNEYQRLPESSPELDPDGISYQIMRWPEAGILAQILAKKINDAGIPYDVIVAPLRGGLFPASIVANNLQLPLYEIGVRRYQNIQTEGEDKESFQIYQDLPAEVDLRGARILVVDEVNHRSGTKIKVTQHLNNRFADTTTLVYWAVMQQKSLFMQEGADYWVEDTSAWVVYPWEKDGSLREDGSILHWPYEFFVDKLPDWMVRGDQDSGPILEPYNFGMERAQAIGFQPDELPQLSDSDFLGRFAFALNAQFNSKFKRSATVDELQYLLPDIQIQGAPVSPVNGGTNSQPMVNTLFHR